MTSLKGVAYLRKTVIVLSDELEIGHCFLSTIPVMVRRSTVICFVQHERLWHYFWQPRLLIISMDFRSCKYKPNINLNKSNNLYGKLSLIRKETECQWPPQTQRGRHRKTADFLLQFWFGHNLNDIFISESEKLKRFSQRPPMMMIEKGCPRTRGPCNRREDRLLINAVVKLLILHYMCENCSPTIKCLTVSFCGPHSCGRPI